MQPTLHSRPYRACTRVPRYLASMARDDDNRHIKVSERNRLHYVAAVAKFLEDEDWSKMFAGEFGEERKFSGKYGESGSPITQATKFLMDMPNFIAGLGLPPEWSEKKIRKTVANGCSFWFWEHASSQRESLADRPRKTRGDWNIPDDEFAYMGGLLTSVKYVDDQGNKRHFDKLEKMLGASLDVPKDVDRSLHERTEAARRTLHLQRIKRRASGKAHKSLDTVLKRVQKKCGCGCL